MIYITDPRTKQNQVTTFKFTKPDVLYAKWEPNPKEPINPNVEIMSKDTCYLTDEETAKSVEIVEEKIKPTSKASAMFKFFNIISSPTLVL